MPDYVEIARRALAGTAHTPATQDPPEVCSRVAAVRREECHRRATEALRSIGGIAGLADALRWLERTQPARWRWLLNVLPGHLDYLWESGARLVRFQEALDTWVAAHRRVAEDYRRKCGKETP